MSKRIINSIAGYLFGGPLGGVFGYFSENIIDKAKEKIQESNEDNGVNMLLLGVSVAKASGKVDLKKIEFVKYYFKIIYGEEKAKHKLKFIQKIIEERFDAAYIARESSREYSYSDKLKILNYLFRIATASELTHPSELKLISILANNLDIKSQDYLQIKKRYSFTEMISSAYEILSCTERDSMQEITTQYRKMVLLYHPDRLKFQDETSKNIANEKFRIIKEAYLTIKRIKSS